MYRLNPKINEAIERTKRGEIGKVCCIEAQMSCRHGEELRDWLKVFPGGMTFFLGCHLIDIIYRIQGEPEEIIPINYSSCYDGVAGDDIGMAVFNLIKGKRLNFKDMICEIHSPSDAQEVYQRLVNEKNFPIGVLFDWSMV